MGSDAVSDAKGAVSDKGAMVLAGFSRGAARRHMAIEEYAVDWDGPGTGAPPPRLRLLLLADVDLASAGRIVEWALQGDKAFDLCVVCGDFIPRPEGWSADSETAEQLSAEEGEMSATLAQLENTVCRVVYVPGPLDPVMPSIHLARAGGARTGISERGVRGAAARGKDGDPVSRETTRGTPAQERLLQLTPTSKNLHRRNLRLAPGLSAAGFTQEPDPPRTHPGGGADSSSSRRDGGTDEGGNRDRTLATLRSLCRSGGTVSGSKKRGGRSAADAVPPAPPSSGPSGRRRPPGAATASGGKALPESVILLTRLGGARWLRRPPGGNSGGGSDASGGVKAALQKIPDGGGPKTTVSGPAEPAAATVTAAQLRQLWTQQQAVAPARAAAAQPDEQAGAGAGAGAGVEGGRGGVLLHVCAGPGASLAVREALSAGAEALQQQEQGGGGVSLPILREDGTEEERREREDGGAAEEQSEGGEEGGESADGGADKARSTGVGCTVGGGCTVAALGSLREDGAYCVVELALPGGEGDRGKRGQAAAWSVASVQFGAVEGFEGDGERETAKRSFARAAAGNFVLNYD